MNWIGFWFHIPGVTLDPTQVTNEFLDGGADVVMSGIDTTEVIVRTGQRAAADEAVWAVPFDYRDACAEAPFICLGVPYFNWGPSYLEVAQSVIDGTFAPSFQWLGPDWTDINNPDTSAVGFVTRRRPHHRRSRPRSTNSSRAWPTDRSTSGPDRSTTRTAACTCPKVRQLPISRSGTRPSFSQGIDGASSAG